MELAERIDVLVKLGDHLRREDDEYLQALIQRTHYHNQWFTPENQTLAIRAIANEFLVREKLEAWLAAYELSDEKTRRNVGLVLAGNIPLVGFHDVLCVFVAGHRGVIKLSDKDQFLLPYLLKLMASFDERTTACFEVVGQLKEYEAVIATGSNNSARYFEAYFGKYPHIIRRNRNAIAVLDGEETENDLLKLGKDVFRYFGLGCRNVSKIYVPKDYVFEPLLEALHQYREIILHNKYKNNFDYNYALLVLNRSPYLANGCIILTENASLQSRIAGLHYDFYNDLQEVEEELKERAAEIQCVVARDGVLASPSFPFGKAQEPALWDYADGVDTMTFLLGL